MNSNYVSFPAEKNRFRFFYSATKNEMIFEFHFSTQLKIGRYTDFAEALQIPPTVRSDQGSVCDGEEALCMLLKRMPDALVDTAIWYICSPSLFPLSA